MAQAFNLSTQKAELRRVEATLGYIVRTTRLCLKNTHKAQKVEVPATKPDDLGLSQDPLGGRRELIFTFYKHTMAHMHPNTYTREHNLKK